MNAITVFNFKDTTPIRTTLIDDVPYFIGKDIAVALGYVNISDSLIKHVDMEDKTTIA